MSTVESGLNKRVPLQGGGGGRERKLQLPIISRRSVSVEASSLNSSSGFTGWAFVVHIEVYNWDCRGISYSGIHTGTFSELTVVHFE